VTSNPNTEKENKQIVIAKIFDIMLNYKLKFDSFIWNMCDQSNQ